MLAFQYPTCVQSQQFEKDESIGTLVYDYDLTRNFDIQSSDNVLFTDGLTIKNPKKKAFVVTERDTMPFEDRTSVLSFSAEWEGVFTNNNHVSFEIRTSPNPYDWTEWSKLPLDVHGEVDDTHNFSEPGVIPKNKKYIQFRIVLDGTNGEIPVLTRLKTIYYNPEMAAMYTLSSRDDNPNKEKLSKIIKETYKEMNEYGYGYGASPRPTSKSYPKPFIKTRKQWDPLNLHPAASKWKREATNVTHFVIHHSAMAETSNNWDLVVQSLWDYHVKRRKWDDIGYNYVIAPNGMIYEARGEDMKGAHFSCRNKQTMGICLLGNFNDSLISSAARESLVRLIAWKADKEHIHPQASSYHNVGYRLPHIAGHRDSNKSSNACVSHTVCPGKALYKELRDIRKEVQNELERWKEGCRVAPPPAKILEQYQSYEESVVAMQVNIEAMRADIMTHDAHCNLPSITQLPSIESESIEWDNEYPNLCVKHIQKTQQSFLPYQSNGASKVYVRIQNQVGQDVNNKIAHMHFAPNNGELILDGHTLPSGLYHCIIESGDNRQKYRLVIP